MGERERGEEEDELTKDPSQQERQRFRSLLDEDPSADSTDCSEGELVG